MLTRPVSRLALLATALATFVTALPGTSTAASSTMIARRFDDGLDSRLAGSSVSSALAALGYTTSTYANGRSAAAAFSDGKTSAVFGVFGHGNAGIVQTDEGPTDEEDEILAAGEIIDVNLGTWAFWSNYLHYLDVDDMRFAVFAGCYTANVDPIWRSFGDVGEQRGVDSIVGWTGLVYYPALCTSCDYSGNYFWSRFATYVRSNDTVATALAKARSDLVALEGNAGGWDAWKFDGAVASPGSVRLAPAGSGEALNSRPFGIDPFDLLELPVARRTAYDVEGREVVDVETTSGVGYRLDAVTGDLLWVGAPASTDESAPPMTTAEAERRAVEFAEAHLPWFRRAAGVEFVTEPTHEDGDALLGYRWRLRTPAGPGPAWVEVELDRRTGNVVYFSASRVAAAGEEVRMTRDDAVAAARRAAGAESAALVSATTDVWHGPRWTVTLDRPGEGLTPDYVQVVVDAATGDVLGVTST